MVQFILDSSFVYYVVSIACVQIIVIQIFESELTIHRFLPTPAFKSAECFVFKSVQCALSSWHQL